MQRKIIAASTDQPSYERASRQLETLAELRVSAKQCERVVERIGQERCDEFEEAAMRFEQLPLPQRRLLGDSVPPGFWDLRTAVVEIDGGRTQLRDERWGQPAAGQKRSWWRESKAASLMTFYSPPQACDPLPDLPPELRDPLFAIPRFLEMKRVRRGEEGGGAETSSAPSAQTSSADADQTQNRWSPEPLVRSVVATCRSYDELARRARAQAYERGFLAAGRKAFLGDGLRVNWRIQRDYFADFEPINDVMHALSYVYAAAVAGSSDCEEAWCRYERWATAVWRGQVRSILPELDALRAACTDEAARDVLGDALRYLTNNAPRMRYDEYRRQGFPITTAHIESTMKQLNRRIKGTEKFFAPEGAEPLIQLCADAISDTDPLPAFWKRRANRATGFRKHRAKL